MKMVHYRHEGEIVRPGINFFKSGDEERLRFVARFPFFSLPGWWFNFEVGKRQFMRKVFCVDVRATYNQSERRWSVVQESGWATPHKWREGKCLTKTESTNGQLSTPAS